MASWLLQGGHIQGDEVQGYECTIWLMTLPYQQYLMSIANIIIIMIE